MSKTIDEQIAELRKQKSEEEWQEYVRDVRPKLQQQVGRCYRYRNSFGGNSKGWWLYIKVAQFVEGDHVDFFLVEKCELRENGNVNIETQTDICGSRWGRHYFEDLDYSSITSDDYDKARAKIFDEFYDKATLKKCALKD